MAIEAEALRARPSAAELATRVCHEEQMVVWSGEVIEALSMIDFLREDWSYEDTIRANATVANCIRSIVESAFGHPELKADLIHRSALAEDTARAAEDMRERCAEIAAKAEDQSSKADSPYDNGSGHCGYEMACFDIFKAIRALPLDKEAADANR